MNYIRQRKSQNQIMFLDEMPAIIKTMGDTKVKYGIYLDEQDNESY